jgi:4-hydroxyphenylacetate 3-monooxygenase
VLATLPIADELLVYSGAPLRNPEQETPYAFVFSIPSHTPGVRFICRESVDYGRSHYDHPLASRFEEMDAVVIFDDVLVPWENIFVCKDVPRCNDAFGRTGAAVHMDHQTVTKNIVKAEFMLGLASLLVNSIGAEVFQHIYEKLAELWLNVETMKACLRAAEADAKLDEWGVMRPDENPLVVACTLFSRMYPRMVEIIQQIGASGLVAMPTEDDVKGPLAEDIRKFYQAARAEAFDRIPMFRLAWDASVSAFASRQVLYERFSRGDPIRVANALVLTHQDQLQLCAERVSEFIRQGRDEAFAKTAAGTPDG